MKDAAAGDGNRNLIHQEFPLSSLLKSITNMLLKCSFFISWVGGEGHNIEEDLAQEIHNKLSKAIVKRMGANKTID